MPDVARFGIVVDATGARREVTLTTDALKKLANGGKEAELALKQLGGQQTVAQVRSIGVVSSTASSGVGRLRGAFTSLAIASGALPGPLGRVASVLAPMAIGGGVTVGVLAGITAISLAYDKLTESARKSAEQNANVIKSLDELRRSQALGPAGELNAQAAIARKQKADADREVARLRAQLAAADPGTAGGMVRLALGQKITAAEIVASDSGARLRAAETEVARLNAAAARAVPALAGVADALAAISARAVGAGGREPFDRFPSLLPVPPGEPTFAPLPGGGTAAPDWAHVLEGITTTQNRQRRNQVLMGLGIGAGTSALRGAGGNTGGVLASGIEGALSGAAGGPLGVAAGAVIGLATSLFGLSSAAKAAKRAEQERIQHINEERIALEKLNTASRNAPESYYVEKYLSQSRFTPITPRGTTPKGSNLVSGANVTVQNMVFQLPRGSTTAMIREFVAALDSLVASTGGSGMTRAAALELA